MKIVSIDRELKIDQNLYIIIIALKTYKKKFPKKENILQKTVKKLMQKIFS